MFCKKCGSQIPDGSKFCTNCGTPATEFGEFKETANDAFQKVGNEFKSAVNDINNTVQGNGSAPSGKLKDDRSLLSYIVLNIITCNIYSWYFLYKIAADVNVACEGDGKSTAGLTKFIILNLITCGIYSWLWYYNLGNRLAENAPRYGMNFQENGTTVLLWLLLGSALCGIGPFVAMNILIKNTNSICAAYNNINGLY